MPSLIGFAKAAGDDTTGLGVFRCRAPLSSARVHALFEELDRRNLIEENPLAPGEDDEPDEAEHDELEPLQLIAFPWTPPTTAEAQRGVIEGIMAEYDIASAHFFQTRAGELPSATTAPFPVEGYPEIIEHYDWYDFGIAMKLAGDPAPGESQVLTLFHQFWLTPYFDPTFQEGDDEDSFDPPFRHADLHWDERHRSALLWVDRFMPADEETLVHHLLWVVNRIAEVVPLQHARFGGAEIGAKYKALTGDDSPHFVLAGNPLGGTFDAEGLEAAEAWTRTQTDWGPAELTEMYLEVMKEHAPDDPEQGRIALRCVDHALELTPEHEAAKFYRLLILLGQDRIDDALAYVRSLPQLATLGLQAAKVLAEEENATKRERAPEFLALVHPDESMLDTLIQTAYQASQEASIPFYEVILRIPMPADGSNRENWLRAVNNLLIQTHAVGRYQRSREVADMAQAFAHENPHIYHSAACSYAAVEAFDDAFAQVEKAVAAEYEHLGKLAVDHDLGPVLEWPEFKVLMKDHLP